MAVWKDEKGLLHDDMGGAALGLPDWPVGLTKLDDDEGLAAQAPTVEQIAAQARARRDALLSACDWTQVADVPLSAAKVAAWKEYRQALRDVTNRAGFPLSIEWPEVVK
jgi:hypothetical protein